MKICTLLLLLAAHVALSQAAAAATTHEDIRDAILSLLRSFRDSTDKLERHELRERHLGEQLKKSLAGLDKRLRAADSNRDALMTAVVRLDARLISVEQALARREEREEALQRALERAAEPNAVESAAAALDRLDANVEQLANRPDWHAAFLSALETQHLALQDVRRQTATAEEQIRGKPTREEVLAAHNATLEALQEAKDELAAGAELGLSRIDLHLAEWQAALSRGHDELSARVAESGVLAEGLTAGVASSYEQLLREVRGLSSVERVLVQTADNVLDTKRRVEYGVHQILIEVGDLIKSRSTELNSTLNRRFDAISDAIIEHQEGGLTNLTAKIETEMAQVWRQIGIMYSQLTASAGALDRLQEQTETYVNGSLRTMGSMEGKVGEITGRMTDVDDSLNYLLGRLSLVTQEFNLIKSGLAGALDNMRSSFVDAQNRIKEMEPLTSDTDEHENQVPPINVEAN